MINNTFQIAGNSAFLSMCPMFNMFAIGVAMSVSSELGNAIGQKKFRVAEKLIKLGFLTVSFLAVSLSLISFFIEDFVAESLTTDDGMRTYFRITYQIFSRYYIYG
jgi:Na+-driven multidrug efflux pump